MLTKLTILDYQHLNEYDIESKVLNSKILNHNLKYSVSATLNTDIIIDIDKLHNALSLEIICSKYFWRVLNKKFVKLPLNKTNVINIIELPKAGTDDDFHEYFTNNDKSLLYIKIGKSRRSKYQLNQGHDVVWEVDGNDILSGIWFFNIKDVED